MFLKSVLVSFLGVIDGILTFWDLIGIKMGHSRSFKVKLTRNFTHFKSRYQGENRRILAISISVLQNIDVKWNFMIAQYDVILQELGINQS
jgi:hypothetical protein